jgi:hypothetical protein
LNFTTLPLGYLPGSAFIRLSDLDNGEGWTLNAFDPSGNPDTGAVWSRPG